MQSRMDKYQLDTKRKYERTKKNTKLYEEVYDDIYRDTTYKNMQVLSSAKEININKLKDMLDDKYDTRQYRTLKNYSIEDLDIEDKPTFNKKRQKIYDINEIINEAKNKRAFIEETKEKQKYIDFAKQQHKEYEYDELSKDEQELEELINTIAIKKQSDDTSDALDVLSDLKGEENTIVTNPISADFDNEKTKTSEITNNLEKTLVKADKTFYTDSNMFTKNDFEDFGTLTKELNKSSSKKKVFIILIVLIILGLITYLVLNRLVFKK